MPPVILVVEDEPAIVDVLGEMLRGFGYEVATAGDGLSAVSTYVKCKPALVLLDYNMPAGSGGDVYHSIRKLAGGESLPVVFLSAVPVLQIQMMVPDSPRVRFLSKPIDIDALKATLEEFLGPAPAQGPASLPARSTPAPGPASLPGWSTPAPGPASLPARPAAQVPEAEDLVQKSNPGPDGPKQP